MHKASSLALAVSLMFVGSGFLKLTAQGGPPQSLPNQASQVAQGIVEFDGELEVQDQDSATGSRLLHFLNTGTRRLQLRFTDAPLDWQSGTRVKVRGRLQDTNTLVLSSSGDVETLSLPTVNTFGEQSTLVILVNFRTMLRSRTRPRRVRHNVPDREQLLSRELLSADMADRGCVRLVHDFGEQFDVRLRYLGEPC